MLSKILVSLPLVLVLLGGCAQTATRLPSLTDPEGSAQPAPVSLNLFDKVTNPIKAITLKDLNKAIEEGDVSLPADDPMLQCYKAVRDVVQAKLTDGGVGLPLTMIMRARIIAQAKEKVGDQIQKSCGEMSMEILTQLIPG